MELNFVLDILLWITALVLATASFYLYLTWNFGVLEKQGVKTKKPRLFIGSMGGFFTQPAMNIDLQLCGAYGRICGYLTWNFGVLEKQGVKTKKPRLFIGSMGGFFTQPAMNIDLQLCGAYGRICGYYEGRNPILLIAEPELIKQITVKDFWAFPFTREFPLDEKAVIAKNFLTSLKGEEWKQMRTLMTPTFTTGKLKQMTHLIEDCCKTLNDHLNKFAETGEPLEARKFMSAFTLDVIALCAFGTKIDCMGNPDNAFVWHASKIFNPKVPPSAILAFFIPFLAKVLPTFNIFPPESIAFFKTVVEQVIEMRKTDKYPRDFLALLLEAKTDEDEQRDKTAEHTTKKGVSTDLLLAQSVLFLAAGYETTAALLSLTLYVLAVNPSVQKELADEVDRVISKNDDKLSYESIAEMNYLDMVLNETLRMYPPVVRTMRTCEVDNYEIAGIKLRKGMLVGFPVYSIHHDPENYPEPEKFIPERFTAENKAKRNPFVYLPFGSGPRNCIAMRFALMEAKLTIASIIREFTIKKCPQTEETLEFAPMKPFLQPKSLTVAVEKRRRI